MNRINTDKAQIKIKNIRVHLSASVSICVKVTASESYLRAYVACAPFA